MSFSYFATELYTKLRTYNLENLQVYNIWKYKTALFK